MANSKAFDVVPHKHLGVLIKLQHYGIKAPYLDWIEDFLNKRCQQVVVNGECSEEAAVTVGVPQDYVLRSGSLQDPVHPHMQYSNLITDPHTQLLINKLERVQCRVTHWVTGEYQIMAI